MNATGRRRRWIWAGSIALNIASLSLAATSRGGQPLETETARLLRHGTFEVEAGVEHQSSSQGSELAFPLAIGYGLSNRLELLVEPVPYSSIHDKGLPSENGAGDVEATLTGLLVSERGHRPAFAIAGECKVPTAQNSRIGSGETDYTVYGIASKRVGRWDTHLNLGYTWVGSPAGTQVNNVQSFGFAEEFQAGPRAEIVGEVLGNTAALSEGNGETGAGSESQVTPEIGGAELVGALGLRYRPDGGIIYTLGVSYDNNSAFLIHPGVTVKW